MNLLAKSHKRVQYLVRNTCKSFQGWVFSGKNSFFQYGWKKLFFSGNFQFYLEKMDKTGKNLKYSYLICETINI